MKRAIKTVVEWKRIHSEEPAIYLWSPVRIFASHDSYGGPGILDFTISLYADDHELKSLGVALTRAQKVVEELFGAKMISISSGQQKDYKRDGHIEFKLYRGTTQPVVNQIVMLMSQVLVALLNSRSEVLGLLNQRRLYLSQEYYWISGQGRKVSQIDRVIKQVQQNLGRTIAPGKLARK